MNGWFIAILFLCMLELGVNMAKHGERREGHHNFGSTLIGQAILISLIYMAIKTGL